MSLIADYCLSEMKVSLGIKPKPMIKSPLPIMESIPEQPIIVTTGCDCLERMNPKTPVNQEKGFE